MEHILTGDYHFSQTALYLLIIIGVLFGVINTLAGGGSMLSLPAFLLLGIPPHAANATNRLGGILQTFSATWSFFRRGVLETKSLVALSFYALCGGFMGSKVSLLLTQQQMNVCIQVCLFSVALFTLLIPKRFFQSPTVQPKSVFVQHLAGFLVSFYGGFLQAGIGLVALYYCRFIRGDDLVSATAIKTMFITVLTLPAMVVFIYYGQVYWWEGGALAIGSVLGAQIGVHLSLSSRGEEIIRASLPYAAILMISGLAWRSM